MPHNVGAYDVAGSGAINNDDRNVYCDLLNLSNVTERFLKTKLHNYSEPRQWHMHFVVGRAASDPVNTNYSS
jgi:hypothetical protein